MNWIDRLIAAIAPAWAYRRQQFREALRAANEQEEPRRRPDDSGWIRLDHPNNPLNPERAVEPCESPRRRQWTW